MSMQHTVDNKAIIHSLLDAPDDVKRIYGVDIYTLISSMVDTNDKQVVSVLTTVASTPNLHDFKQNAQVAASYKTQLNKSVTKQNKELKSKIIKNYLLNIRTICQKSII